MSHAFAMTARHLMSIRQQFDNGVPHHFTDPKTVDDIKALIKRAATRLDYSLPTNGTAHLRINYIIKEGTIKESWTYGGGVLTSEDVDAHIDQIKNTVTQGGKLIKETHLTCHILNEWERYSVVFELVITVGKE